MCLAQGPQRSDAGEAQTCSPSVSGQALYHWATALPSKQSFNDMIISFKNYLSQYSQTCLKQAVKGYSKISCLRQVAA